MIYQCVLMTHSYCSILKGLVKALAHLQAHSVVHRDIKPDNILLTADGDAKLSDFGVALVRLRCVVYTYMM